jgi:hypothetical protein
MAEHGEPAAVVGVVERGGVVGQVKKNCEFAEFGSLFLAMAIVPKTLL